jgi:hypothetical protein
VGEEGAPEDEVLSITDSRGAASREEGTETGNQADGRLKRALDQEVGAMNCLWPGCFIDWVADKLLLVHPVMAAICRRSGPRFCRQHTDEFFDVTGHLNAESRSLVFRAMIECREAESRE